VAELRSYVARDRLVAAYGAPARGVTLLNYYGLGPDVVACVADASPAKQGRYMPVVRVPVVSPGALLARRPDDILILNWDLATEVVGQLRAARSWGARFHAPLPQLHGV
jgi:hypothetical protein